MKRQKTGGRKAGTPNQVTTDLRQWITSFIEDNKAQIEADWQSLAPKDRIQLFEKLLKYALPTLQAMQLNTDFDTLSESDLDRIIDELKTASNEKL
jgi:hypothetical protein